MPEADFWDEYVQVSKRNQREEWQEKFRIAVSKSDSAEIDECLKSGWINIDENDGQALKTLLDYGDFINAVKLLDAGASLYFTHERYEYDPNDCYPYTTKVTDTINLLEGRGITRQDIYSLAELRKQDLVEQTSQAPRLG